MMHGTQVDVVDQHIVKTLLYYDIFNYPLKAEEVYRFLGTNHTDETTIRNSLERLVEQNHVFRFGELFSVQNDELLANRRRKGNAEAEKFLPLALEKAKVISRFPFVRAVMSSGSLSKGYMDEKSDLDFFIVTKPGRLWIARTLLVIYKRLFLFNSHKYFCVNYFVDYDHLEIEEKNLFTATELATALPLIGGEYYHRLHEKNSWMRSFFPNYKQRPVEGVPEGRIGWLKRTLESCFNFLGGDRLEKFFQHLTEKRWRNLYGKEYGSNDFQVAFKTKSYASKNHPNHYQKKVIEMYEQKVKAFGLSNGGNS
jgi:hypothetical protein